MLPMANIDLMVFGVDFLTKALIKTCYYVVILKNRTYNSWTHFLLTT